MIANLIDRTRFMTPTERKENSLISNIDFTESLKPLNPFMDKIRELVDKEFPLVGTDNVRRDYPVMAEILDGFAKLNLFESLQERQVLGQESAVTRLISIPEATVAVTLLAGKEYRRGGRHGFEAGSLYFRGDLQVQTGNEVYALFLLLKDRKKFETERQMSNICGLVVGGIWGVSRIDETFAKRGVKYFMTDEVMDFTQKWIDERENKGDCPEGGSLWWQEFTNFVSETADSPLGRYLLVRLGIFGDPYSDETKEKFAKAIQTVEEAKLADTTLARVATYLRVSTPSTFQVE